MPFYDNMADVVQEFLAPEDEGGLGRGAVHLRSITSTPGPTPWDPPTETWELKFAVKRFDQRYEDGVLIIATGDIFTFAVPPVAPVLTDSLIVDGGERAITNLRPTSSAGTVVAWRTFCADYVSSRLHRLLVC